MIAPLAAPLDDLDAQLMVRVRDGEHDLFDQIVTRNQRRVAGLIRHMLPGGSDVEDLTQNVFLKVFRGRHGYQPTARFSTWLFTITTNEVLNARRRLARCREIQLDSIDGDSVVGDRQRTRAAMGDPVERAIRRETQNEVRSAIRKLGHRQQQVIGLVVLNGYRYRTAGEDLQISEKAVKSLVCRAKQNLKLHLQDRGKPRGRMQ